MNETYEEHQVQFVPLEENVIAAEVESWNPTIIEVLELIHFLPLKDQAIMMTNFLTISGYSVKEISEALDINYGVFRKSLWSMRQEFIKRGTWG